MGRVFCARVMSTLQGPKELVLPSVCKVILPPCKKGVLAWARKVCRSHHSACIGLACSMSQLGRARTDDGAPCPACLQTRSNTLDRPGPSCPATVVLSRLVRRSRMTWSAAKQQHVQVAPSREQDGQGNYGNDYRRSARKLPREREHSRQDMEQLARFQVPAR